MKHHSRPFWCFSWWYWWGVMMECTNPRLCMVLDTLLSMVGAGLALGGEAAVGNVSHSWLTRDLPMLCKELVCPALQIKHTICLWQKKKNAQRRLTKPFFFPVQFLYLSKGFYEMESEVGKCFPALCLKGDGFVKTILTSAFVAVREHLGNPVRCVWVRQSPSLLFLVAKCE